MKEYKGFQFRYRRGNAERESSYDIYHNYRMVATGENLKDCYKKADDLLSRPNILELRKFLLGDRLPKKKPVRKPTRKKKR